MDIFNFFLKNDSKKVTQECQRFDILHIENKPDTKSFDRFFLKKLREIVSRRKNHLPTESQEKILKEYRDYDLKSR